MVALTVLTMSPATTAHAAKKARQARVAAAAVNNNARYCSNTAELQEQACLLEARGDNAHDRAICLNISDAAERAACNADATAALRDGTLFCDEVDDEREALCGLVGESRYEPDFDPAHFDDPRHPSIPNPYLPLAVGNHWTFTEGPEIVDITILDATKEIDGIGCIVMRDLVTVDGEAVEDTDDWFGFRTDGAVMYCGEEVKDYETFPNDDPIRPELVSRDGSFKHGRDGDKGGIIMPGTPLVGMTYRQEFSAGNAEDAATVLSTTYRYGQNAVLDAFVPPALANLLCGASDCLVTREFSPMSPGVYELKYYTRGIGQFLATTPNEGKSVELIECNMDARCASLPQP
jgi:hypothetical protein